MARPSWHSYRDALVVLHGRAMSIRQGDASPFAPVVRNAAPALRRGVRGSQRVRDAAGRRATAAAMARRLRVGVMASVALAAVSWGTPRLAAARGLEFGVDAGAALVKSPGVAVVTHFHVPLGYLSYEPALRVGVPLGARWTWETGLGVDEVTPHDTTGLHLDDLLPRDTGHYSHWRGRLCLLLEGPGDDPERRAFGRLGPIVNARHYHGKTRLQFGGTAALGWRIPLAPRLGLRVEAAYSYLDGTSELPRAHVYAVHAGMSGFTR